MAWYTDLPSSWQTELEKTTAVRIAVEVVYDPDGDNIVLTGKYSVVDISPITIYRELEIEWATRPTTQDVFITFHDPDDYFNPENTASPFHNAVGELDRDHAAGSTSIKILDKSGIAFQVNETLVIDDSTNEEEINVDAYTAAAGSTYYHEITYNTGLTYRYDKYTRVFTKPIENKDILIRLVSPNCASHIHVFKGKLLKPPECSAGKATLILVESKKILLDKVLEGADTDEDTKLMRIDENGDLVSSIVWS